MGNEEEAGQYSNRDELFTRIVYGIFMNVLDHQCQGLRMSEVNGNNECGNTVLLSEQLGDLCDVW